MATDAKALRQKLKDAGLSKAAIDAAWPKWWSEEAAKSPAAQAELRFTVSRKLGLSPKSLFNEGDATFLWQHNAKFKSYTGGLDDERAAIVSFATSLGRLVLSAVDETHAHEVPAAGELRAAMLNHTEWVDVRALVAASWSLGIPIIYLKVLPLVAKRMSAMAVRVGDRSVILLARSYTKPSPVGFYIGHEIGHLHHGHVGEGDVLVDMGDVLKADSDKEEMEADEFALELLTGSSKPTIDTGGIQVIGANLAQAAIDAAPTYRVEPGMIALCYGHQSGNWKSTWAALNLLYPSPINMWAAINKYALTQLDLSKVSTDSADYLRTVMGYGDDD